MTARKPPLRRYVIATISAKADRYYYGMFVCEFTPGRLGRDTYIRTMAGAKRWRSLNAAIRAAKTIAKRTRQGAHVPQTCVILEVNE